MTERERFYSKVSIGEGGCHEFAAPADINGYRRFGLRGKSQLAHRVALILEGVELPKGMHVDHLCRNRGCVNPEHLEVVTPLVNSRRSTGTKLTPDDVREIRRAFQGWEGSLTQFGKRYGPRFGVSLTCVVKAALRQTWKDVS